MTTTYIATLPRSIYIEPTSRCNELCQQCPRTLLSREDDRDLNFDNFRFIVDQFPVLERVVLHGLGEPLQRRVEFHFSPHLAIYSCQREPNGNPECRLAHSDASPDALAPRV